MDNIGVANGLLKILGLGKFWSDLEILCGESQNLDFAFMNFLHLGLKFFVFIVSGSDFQTRVSASRIYHSLPL